MEEEQATEIKLIPNLRTLAGLNPAFGGTGGVPHVALTTVIQYLPCDAGAPRGFAWSRNPGSRPGATGAGSHLGGGGDSSSTGARSPVGCATSGRVLCMAVKRNSITQLMQKMNKNITGVRNSIH